MTDKESLGRTVPQLHPQDVPREEIRFDKELRRDIDAQLQKLKAPFVFRSRERSLAITKLQEAIMWLGMDLKRISEEGGESSNPYPQSYNPESPAVEPTADGLKL